MTDLNYMACVRRLVDARPRLYPQFATHNALTVASIIEGAGEKLHIPIEKVVITVDQHANTSAASVPLALTEAVTDGRIKRGDLVMIEAMGGGFTWGAALARF